MTKAPTSLVCCVLLGLASISLGAEKWFPEWRGSRKFSHGVWLASPIVAVGEIVNIRIYGKQTLAHIPPPMSQDVHNLIWCQGDFRVVAVVKGELAVPPPKYLWASGKGCNLSPWPDQKQWFERRPTKVWFLREEGGFLRPTYDGGLRFIGLFTSWKDGSDLPARQHLGALFLTPAANTETLKEYADYLWDVGDIACELLGDDECERRIRELSRLGDPKLRENSCGFLKGQLGRECDIN